MTVSNFTSVTFSVVKKYTQLACIFVSKISHRKSTLKFACKKSVRKSSCKNLHASFLCGFFMEIRHIARNLHARMCCNARGLYCTFVSSMSCFVVYFMKAITYMYLAFTSKKQVSTGLLTGDQKRTFLFSKHELRSCKSERVSPNAGSHDL